jgi:repressor LexA
MDNLSQKQARLYGYIREHVQREGYPPTYDEICADLGYSTKSLVRHHLDALIAKGYLERKPGASRGLRLAARPQTHGFTLPVLGVIAAGIPTTSDQVLEAVELTRDIVRDQGDGLYGLRVRGESMIDALIHDGDIVVMKHQQDARDGEMVAVRLKDRDEYTLKRFYRENGRIRLQPANPSFPALYAHPANVEVQGRVVAVIRQL